MARLIYDTRARKDRFTLRMNRKEAAELLLAVKRWGSYPGAALYEVGSALREFFEAQKQSKESDK